MMRWPLVPVLLLSACQAGVGEIAVTAWGEDRATSGFAAQDFADGWSVRFDTVAVHLGQFTAIDPRNDAVVGEADGSFLVDLADATTADALTAFEAPAERVGFGFATFPATADATVIGVDPTIATRMAEEGLSRLIIGEATLGSGGATETIAFELAFTDAYSASGCNNGRDGTPGLAVSAQSTTEAEITVHLDHLFWSAVGTEEADLRFQPWADAAVDGRVTLTELAAVDTAVAGYETAGLDLPDLAAFIGFSFASSAHLNGLGLCTIRSL